jgi:hypothetical protein
VEDLHGGRPDRVADRRLTLAGQPAPVAAWPQLTVNSGRGCLWRSLGKHPGFPTTWTRVLEQNPEAMKPDALPGYVWLATPGKVLHADERHLEFTGDPEEGS